MARTGMHGDVIPEPLVDTIEKATSFVELTVDEKSALCILAGILQRFGLVEEHHLQELECILARDLEDVEI